MCFKAVSWVFIDKKVTSECRFLTFFRDFRRDFDVVKRLKKTAATSTLYMRPRSDLSHKLQNDPLFMKKGINLKTHKCVFGLNAASFYEQHI